LRGRHVPLGLDNHKTRVLCASFATAKGGPTLLETRSSSTEIDDEMIEQFVEEAERGYEPGQRRGKPQGRGRPPLGSAAKESSLSALILS
jgi:hypothetical protein